MEEAFGRGETPDMQSLNFSGPAQDIFRAPVFESKSGEMLPAKTSPEKVIVNEIGETRLKTGEKVAHDSYDGDAWLTKALEEDPVLKSLAKKMGVENG